ncbi:MAG: aqpZ2 [Firmicutes bacterium]|nr:aqpZ2 [Bacillota bacterium]
MDIKKYIAEFVGTFFLVFAGTGAIIIDQLSNNALGHIGVSLVFGFIIVVMIYACGHISGAHFNPAVTVAFFTAGKFNKALVVPYVVSQILGGLCASALLWGMFGNQCDLGATVPSIPVGNILVAVSFIAEFVFTFLLMFVIMGVATDSRAEGSFAGLAIGLTVFIGAEVVGPVSGGSFNPARSVAPALVSGNLDHLWLYIIAPILGAVCAAMLYNFLGNDAEAPVLQQPITREILERSKVIN